MNIKKSIATAVLVATLALTGCGFTSFESDNSTSEIQSNSEDANKIYTIDEICQRADEEKRFASEHSDEVFTITGTIDRISYKSVYFESNVDKSTYTKYQVECEFDDKDKIKDLSKNDIVTISGKLYHLILSEVTLKDCTLISVENSSDTSEDTSSTSISSEESTSSSTVDQPTESSSQNSSASSETSSDKSEPESSDVESSSTQSSEVTPEPPQSSTETTPQSSEPPIEEPSLNGITLVSFNDNFRRNEDATIKVQGKPNTEYNIKVYYSSGASKADGLEPKMSDSEGYVSWTWHVGGSTSTKGTKRLTISGGGEKFETTFTVSE